MHRCFVDNLIGDEKSISVSGDEAKHISRVMRLTVGDRVEVCDGSGMTYPAEITAVSKSEVTLSLKEGKMDESEPKTKVILFAGLSKGAKMELVIQKSVELGVHAVVPVATEYAVAKEGKPERWQRIAFEAAKQCKRPKVPKIYDAVSFSEAVSMLEKCSLSLCAYEKETAKSAASALKKTEKLESVGIFVGPEGGFSEKETETLQAHGVQTVSLGKRILRTETAAIVFLTVVMFCLGELD